MRREKAERIVDICSDVRLSHGTVHKIGDDLGRIKESEQSGTKVL
jgi:hypothetical protein